MAGSSLGFSLTMTPKRFPDPCAVGKSFDYGWLGFFGLSALFGLLRRDAKRNPIRFEEVPLF